MREHISWGNRLKLENAGAHFAGETAKAGKCGSISRGRNNYNWKMREHMSWAKELKLKNAGAHLMGE